VLSKITSVDGTVTVTNPTGPTVDLSVPDIDVAGSSYPTLSGSGPPQGVVSHTSAAQTYLDTDAGDVYEVFGPSPGTRWGSRLYGGDGNSYITLAGANAPLQGSTSGYSFRDVGAAGSGFEGFSVLSDHGPVSLTARTDVSLVSGGSFGGNKINIYHSGTGSSGIFIDTSAGGGPINITAQQGAQLTAAVAHIDISAIGGDGGGGPSFLTLDANVISIGRDTTAKLGFFGHLPSSGPTGVVQQTVTGSRGGNAALASLLTALNNYGLIVNSSTP
jgi:hypothetical protein